MPTQIDQIVRTNNIWKKLLRVVYAVYAFASLVIRSKNWSTPSVIRCSKSKQENVADSCWFHSKAVSNLLSRILQTVIKYSYMFFTVFPSGVCKRDQVFVFAPKRIPPRRASTPGRSNPFRVSPTGASQQGMALLQGDLPLRGVGELTDESL